MRPDVVGVSHSWRERSPLAGPRPRHGRHDGKNGRSWLSAPGPVYRARFGKPPRAVTVTGIRLLDNALARDRGLLGSKAVSRGAGPCRSVSIATVSWNRTVSVSSMWCSVARRDRHQRRQWGIDPSGPRHGAGTGASGGPVGDHTAHAAHTPSAATHGPLLPSTLTIWLSMSPALYADADRRVADRWLKTRRSLEIDWIEIRRCVSVALSGSPDHETRWENRRRDWRRSRDRWRHIAEAGRRDGGTLAASGWYGRVAVRAGRTCPTRLDRLCRAGRRRNGSDPAYQLCEFGVVAIVGGQPYGQSVCDVAVPGLEQVRQFRVVACGTRSASRSSVSIPGSSSQRPLRTRVVSCSPTEAWPSRLSVGR